MSNPRTEGTQPIKIVVLYAEMVGYVVGMLDALVHAGKPIQLDVVYWDKKGVNSTRFAIEQSDSVHFHARSSLEDAAMIEFLRNRDPDIIVVSGWMDSGYVRALKRYRKSGKAQIVCGIDDQWRNSLRQHLGRLYFRLFYASLFDFMWVSGKPQYHYANRMGYDHERIICNLYSADTRLFVAKAPPRRRFIFVGRFDPVKALDQLIEAYLRLPAEVQARWPLVLIGDGELRASIEKIASPNIQLLPFLQPSELMQELSGGGVACITSHREQWGVAIHEMALLGFPLVLSSACGAATEFLITGYNGYLFTRSNVASLETALRKVTELSDEELAVYSERSHTLGKRITTEQSAHSLLSVLELSGL